MDAWAPLGVVLVAAAALLLAAGASPPRLLLAAGGFLIASGAWSVLSVTWGGLPNEAWTVSAQSLLAAAALVCGSILAGRERRALVGLAVLAGIAAQAAEVLARLAVDAYPPEWLYDRTLEGPVSDHNAQAALFALALPIAVWQMSRGRTPIRLAAGMATGLLVGGMLLTQSRGTVIALGLALVVQLVWARSAPLVLPAALVAGATVVLFLPLREVDAALVAGGAGDRAGAFREYALWTALVAVVIGALAAAPLPRRLARPLAAGIGVLLLAGGVAYAVGERDSLERARSALLELESTQPLEADPGATRFGRFALSGRRDAWRIARDMAAEEPLVGAGEGQFAPRWALDRRITGIYVIQPHSLELELLSELGIVGLLLFAGFAVLVVVALLRAPDRGASAAALAVLTVLLVRASIDYTWSFPGVVAPALLFAGAAAGPPSWRRLRSGAPALVAPLAAGVVAVAALVVFGAPYLADRHLDRASALEAADRERAWEELAAARRLNPWHPEVVVEQGRLAEAAGHFGLAAEHYRRAAKLSFYPSFERFREARALAEAGDLAASRAACRRAIRQNPAEERIRVGPCAGDLLVSSAPDRSEAQALEGATVAGTIYVFATADTDVDEVRFFLDDPRRSGPPAAVERFRPFDFAGGLERVRSGPAGARPFDTAALADGEHTITAVAVRDGRSVGVTSATFTIANGRGR